MKNTFNKNVIPMHQIGFPIRLEIMIPEDDSVRLLYKIRSGLNYTKSHEAYSTIGRNPAIAPESLFRILIYGYMEGIYSSRDLEKACKRDINFKWLLHGQKVPEHNTIARFKSERLSSCIEDLFSQFILKLRELNEIKFENIFIDGKGKRKSKLQRFVESLEEFIERQIKYDEYNNIFDGRNSFSKTYHDSTFMHLKEDHMKNGQLKPAYNIQIGVEGEYIVGVDISSERSDQLTLIPFLDRLELNLNTKYEL